MKIKMPEAARRTNKMAPTTAPVMAPEEMEPDDEDLPPSTGSTLITLDVFDAGLESSVVIWSSSG
jgi:hypothetical protein